MDASPDPNVIATQKLIRSFPLAHPFGLPVHVARSRELHCRRRSKPPSPQFADVTRVKERPGFPIASDLNR
jgi:hypothetical protein